MTTGPILPVTIVGQTLNQKSGTDCNIADTLERMDCARLYLKWPKVEQGSDALKQSVDKWVNSYLSGILAPSPDAQTGAAASIEAAAKTFFKTHQAEEKSVMKGGWAAESAYKVLLNNDEYLTLEIQSYSYQGGAHGNTTSAIASFDVQTGRQLTWNDLVTDTLALKKMAEQQFRETRADIFKPTDGNEPFKFDDAFSFVLPQNYGLAPGGIYAHYNPYEVTPYALGSTQMTLSADKLGALAKIQLPAAPTVTEAPKPVEHGAKSKSETAAKAQATSKERSPSKKETRTKPAHKSPQAHALALPVVTLKQNGDILLNGKKVGMNDLQKQLQAQLLTYATVPNKVDFKTVGETGMGMRAEINTMINDAIAGAKWVRKKAALEALNTAVGKKLGASTQLELGTYQNNGTFAYISARPKLDDGSAIDYAKTEYAKDQSAAWFSDNVIGLLQFEKGAWKLLAYNIGQRKPPVEAWAKKYRAPRALFGK